VPRAYEAIAITVLKYAFDLVVNESDEKFDERLALPGTSAVAPGPPTR